MVDDQRQDVANLIAQWAWIEGDGPFYLNDFNSGFPTGAAYRLADAIVSAGQVLELEVPVTPHVPYLDN
jgi:hypothetical protein